MRVFLACLAVAGGLLASSPAAHAGTYPVPSTPASLPAAIEELAPYVPQDSCDPTDKPGTTLLAHLLVATYPDTSIIGESYACGSDGGVSEHYEGRALDWAIDRTNAGQVGEAHALLDWLFGNDASGIAAGNARRLGVMYAIYNAKIIGTYDLADGWRANPCSGVTGCHQDHVHLSLSWAGAAGATSWWSGTVAPTDYGPCVPDGFMAAPTVAGRAVNPTPCPSHVSPAALPAAASAALGTLPSWSGATLTTGSRGPVVTALQTVLGVTADGSFGAMTTAALQAFQNAHGLAATGVTDLATWGALLGSPPIVAAATPAPAAVVPVARAAVVKKSGRPPTLKVGSHGISVKLVQGRLHVRVTGYYGKLTMTAVKKFQKQHRLHADGVVGPRTWQALRH